MIEYMILRGAAVLVGIIYPAIRSYKVLYKQETNNYKRWLMYWSVFALFSFVEAILNVFIFDLPFYYEAKLALLVFLLNPFFNGTSILYNSLIHRWVKRHYVELEAFLNQGKIAMYNIPYTPLPNVLTSRPTVLYQADYKQAHVRSRRSRCADGLLDVNTTPPLRLLAKKAVGRNVQPILEEEETDGIYEDTSAASIPLNPIFVAQNTETESQQPSPAKSSEAQEQPMETADEEPLHSDEEAHEQMDIFEEEANESESSIFSKIGDFSIEFEPIVNLDELKSGNAQLNESVTDQTFNNVLNESFKKQDRDRSNSMSDDSSIVEISGDTSVKPQISAKRQALRPRKSQRKNALSQPVKRPHTMMDSPSEDGKNEETILGDQMHEKKRRSSKK